MDDLQELLIREEARFVLWALRCAAGDEGALAELERGFELADVAETAGPFWCFAQALCGAAGDRIAWHEPSCACVSAAEMAVLHQLATVAERLHLLVSPGVDPAPCSAEPDWGWQALVPAMLAPTVDRLARDWLAALCTAGICFPTPSRMIASLSPLQNFIEPPGPARLQ